jgi:molybdopterin-guanine dinucleotide biosynthesis protein A
MGRPKAMLPFGSECMLQRIVRLVGEAVEPIAVVAAEGQSLPPLPPHVLLAHDEQPNRGPLEGLRVGLAALASRADAAFVTSCDVPLLKPAVVKQMTEWLGTDEIVVPKDQQFHHPLAAVYRTSLVDRITGLLRADRLRPVYLFDLARTREVDVAELRAIDPDLHSLWNLNQPEDYEAALALPTPDSAKLV